MNRNCKKSLWIWAASMVSQPSQFREGLAHLSLLARGEIEECPPPFAGVDPRADSDQLTATHRRRSYRGGILDQGEPVGGNRVEGGSPRRGGDGEGVSDDVDDGDSSDNMLPTLKVWTQAGYEVMRSSSM
jgi:hypothetical protein